MFGRKGLAPRWLLAGLLTGTAGSTAIAQENPPAPRDGVEQRIDQHRKADAVVVVVDAQGRPVPGAEVEVEQTRHAFRFGCNIFLWGRVGSPSDEAAYRERFAEVFNYATLPFYWPTYEPRAGEPDHANREEVARWCREHGIEPKGHPLAWNDADPRWLPDDPAEVRRLQMARIDDIVARFRGLVTIWDVVNEATHFERDESWQRSPKITAMWDQTGRVPFILECFRHARAANPEATLLINDYRVDRQYARLLQDLIDSSGGTAPFDVIGLQSHMHREVWDDAQAWEVCERFARFGKPLHFTELTILSGEPGWERAQRDRTPWPSTPEGEIRQADEVERIYTLLFSHPSVEAITWWDFSDRGAWQRAPAGFLRADLSPKPAYDRLRDLIKNRWWTRASLDTDASGRAPLRAFLGDHAVTVRYDGRTATAPFTVARGEDNTVTVRLP
jgi:GH35 family endo-1,4-beta-xylanase